LRQVSAQYFLSTERNQVRLPFYSRLDVRFSKAFLFRKSKLTLAVEVLNVLNRQNLRYAGFDGYLSTGRVLGQLEHILPVLPSAGIAIDF